MKKYPDMTELFALKEARRRKLANLPIAEKMEIAQRLQEIARHAPGRHASPGKRAQWKLVGMRPKNKNKRVA
jgi:hypothetical protein